MKEHQRAVRIGDQIQRFTTQQPILTFNRL